jgi:hypothetical protein
MIMVLILAVQDRQAVIQMIAVNVNPTPLTT